MYAFMRKIFPKDEFKDIYKELWAMQKNVPFI